MELRGTCNHNLNICRNYHQWKFVCKAHKDGVYLLMGTERICLLVLVNLDLCIFVGHSKHYVHQEQIAKLNLID